MKLALIVFCVGLMVFSVAQAAFVLNPVQELDNHVEDGNVLVVEETLTTSISGLRACTNNACRAICNALGFPKGVCISATVCRCSR